MDWLMNFLGNFWHAFTAGPWYWTLPLLVVVVYLCTIVLRWWVKAWIRRAYMRNLKKDLLFP